MKDTDNVTLLSQYVKDLEEQKALDLVRQRIARGDDPLEIITEAQAGMQGVGALYEQQKYFISGLMMAGEIFREVMELVEPELIRKLSGEEAGHVLIGTVSGDIHDIGKNIFCTMLRCYGFTVTDLGVDIPAEMFIEGVIRHNPDIIALSGVLTSAYDSMQETVQLIRRLSDSSQASTPVIIGGGLINESVCEYVGADHWAGDALRGVELCKQLELA